jgi:integrase
MINRDNYHDVLAYLAYHSDVLQHDPQSVVLYRSYLRVLLRWADETPFPQASMIRPVFPQYVVASGNEDADVPGQGFSQTFVKRVCGQARSFFKWAKQHLPKRYRLITREWIETLRPARLPGEIRKEHQAVTLEDVRKLMRVRVAPGDISTQRDKAAGAFLFLSGMRGGAFVTLRIACVNLSERTVMQLPEMGVKTKFKKAAITRLLEIPDLLEAVNEWDAFVRSRLPPDALWYPPTDSHFGKLVISARAVSDFRPSNLRVRLKHLFRAARLPPMSPHKFRHGHAVFGLTHAQNIADLKAVSMNLMHSNIGITDGVYAVLSDKEMQERIRHLSEYSETIGTRPCLSSPGQ